jgi:hypothetical protein
VWNAVSFVLNGFLNRQNSRKKISGVAKDRKSNIMRVSLGSIAALENYACLLGRYDVGGAQVVGRAEGYSIYVLAKFTVIPP